MQSYILNWITISLGLLIAIEIVPGLNSPKGIVNFIVLIAIFLIISTLIRPIIWYLTLPINVITIGSFTLIINAFVLYIANWISNWFNLGFTIEGFFSAVIGALTISIVQLTLKWIFNIITNFKPYKKDRDWVEELEKAIKWLEEQRDKLYETNKKLDQIIKEQNGTIEKLKNKTT